MIEPGKLTAVEARALLQIYKPREVAHVSKAGKFLDDDGSEIDKRQTVAWTMALGPFGSWPSTVEDADKDFTEHAEWWYGQSFRLGWVVVYRNGWGYQAVEPEKIKEMPSCPS